MRVFDRIKVRPYEAALFLVLLVAGLVFWGEIYASASPARTPYRQLVKTTGPGSSTISLQVPAFCLRPTAVHRTYLLTIPAADTYARSGEHGHGKLTCIVFMTPSYSKVLVIDQAAGGYTIGPLGLDVTYVDCGLPGYRFPPNSIDNGPNDCADVGAATEGNWLFTSGAFTGQPMIPGSTP